MVQTRSISLLLGDDRERGLPVAELVDHFYNHTFSWKVLLCPFNVPGTAYYSMLQDGELLQSRLLDWAAKCKREALDNKDLFSIVAKNPDEKGASLTDLEIIGHVPPLMVAAFETCQNALIWTLVLLCQHPRIARDLLDELQGRLAGAAPTLDRIGDLPLLDAVINESLRLLPPVPQQFRIATKDTTLGGFPVPRTTKVLLSPFLTNRDPDLYPEPDRFKPDRWGSISPSPYEFFSFSAGPWICPGYGFGTSLVKALVATILTRFRVALAPNALIDHKVTLTLTPKGRDSSISSSPRRCIFRCSDPRQHPEIGSVPKLNATPVGFGGANENVGKDPMAFARNAPVLVADLSRTGLPRPLADAATPYLHRLLGFEQFNSVYRQLPPCKPEDFSRTLSTHCMFALNWMASRRTRSRRTAR